MLAATATAPARGFWRVARGPDSLALPRPSDFTHEAGTLGNRFDSPLGDYSVLYFSSTLEGCFMETLARFRPVPGLKDIVEDEWREMGFMEVGGVPADWRHSRLAVRASPDPSLPFLDVEDPNTIEVLRDDLAPTLALHGYTDLDISVIRGNDRRVSRAISHWAYVAFAEAITIRT